MHEVISIIVLKGFSKNQNDLLDLRVKYIEDEIDILLKQ
jgi:hypothetical protein